MHIMSRFTLTHLKRNKRHAFFTCFAIFIATLFISALMFFAYSYKQSIITLWIENGGEWHSAVGVGISAKQAAYIKENPEVEKTFIKTNFYALKPENIEGRPYFAHIDLDKNYRNDMGWENLLISGRLPEKEDEISVTKDFFIDNPDYEIGSQLVVDEGKRIADEEEVDVREPLRGSEIFETTRGNKIYTIVGELDASYEFSNIPAYMSMGYSDKLLEDKTYIVNIQFKNVKETYELTPKIAAHIGLTTDTEGKYPVRYNSSLLEEYGVFDEAVSDRFISMMTLYIGAGLVILSFFITIIYHTFAVSAKSRVKYLGLLKSIGATPKQIRHSILFEGLLLSCIGIPFGLLGGYGIAKLIFNYLNETYTALEMDVHLDVYVSLVYLVVIIVMTLGVVLVSAYFPARKVARLSPIVAIKQGDYKIARLKDTAFTRWIGKVLGYEGTLALKSNKAHGKGFRTAYISLTLSFVILMSGMLYLKIWNLSVNYNPSPIEYDMKIYLSDVEQEEFERLDREVREIEQVEKVQRNKGPLYGYTKVSPGELSEELREKGLKYLEQEIPLTGGEYDFVTEILAMDDDSFTAYCEKIGANAADFYESEGVKAILYNRTTYNDLAIREEQESIPLFNWKEGDRIRVTENLGRQDKMKTPYIFDVEIGYVTDQMINHGRYYDYYRTVLIMPESISEKLVENLSENNQKSYNRDISYLEIAEKNISEVKVQIEQIYEKHKDKANFRIWDTIVAKEGQQKTMELILGIAGTGVLFISLIGIANIYSTVSNQINMRRREFAMLKSIGISPKGIEKILFLESIFYSVKPIIYSVPLLIGFGLYLLNIMRLRWINIFGIFPYGTFLTCGVVLSGVIFSLSYLLSRKIMKETIIDVIKDEIQ